ncbi:MAG: GNAT family N-acetyltransferase [Woeseiaceae bacterium]|jgi:predicted GNAT superfamily acetyltransferase
MQLLDVTETDLADVVALNQASLPHVSSMGRDQAEWFARHAWYFRIARIAGEFAGFLIGLRPGIAYGSENYRWFSENYRDFGYIDRVAVAAQARRQGVASSLYDDFASALRDEVAVMTCEVNIRPPNESSMRFHEMHGFRQVASQETEGGTKEVAMMEKVL